MDELIVVLGSSEELVDTSPCDEIQFLAEVNAESIGWLPLEEGVYLHVGNPDEEEVVITVVGIADAAMAGLNVLLGF